MKELLVTIASALVEDKSAVQVTVDEPDAEGVVVYHLHVAQEDMGRVIGKQGRIAKGYPHCNARGRCQSRRKDLRRDRLIQKGRNRNVPYETVEKVPMGLFRRNIRPARTVCRQRRQTAHLCG